MGVHGILLAAGAGTRMGMPKALVRTAAGEPWVLRGVRVLRGGGCSRIVVVLGAEADRAAALLDPSGTAAGAGAPVDVVVAEDWADGMSASLRAGLGVVAGSPEAEVALVHLVDLPDVGAAVIARVLAEAAGPATLCRASYDGVPGHPVLIGRDHWAGVLDVSGGDRGARDYLAAHEVTPVECGDLATGHDQDR
ncbi:NTP transferase domain-containing protein [Nocardioides sp.]|uniref:nucleotidyltransferase family protein n=1 Tax=Nocardioides sp. TaxID=35761 RepID=UPI003569D565